MNAAAGIDCQKNRKWHLRLAFKNRDLLRNIVFCQQEIVTGQIPHNRTIRVRDIHKHVNQFYVDANRRRCILSSAGKDCPSKSAVPINLASFAASPAGRVNIGWEWFPRCPNSAILEKFLFPDRHRALEGVDEPAAGIEGGSAMG